MAPSSTEPSAWHLARLFEPEDEEIARLVADAPPGHARTADIAAVVEASGYSRTLVEMLRSRRHPWARPD